MGHVSVHSTGHFGSWRDAWLASNHGHPEPGGFLDPLLDLLARVSADGLVATASLYGAVAGLLAVWRLSRKPLVPLRKCWQLHAKEVSYTILLICLSYIPKSHRTGC